LSTFILKPQIVGSGFGFHRFVPRIIELDPSSPKDVTK